jgi:hypothetical protein
MTLGEALELGIYSIIISWGYITVIGGLLSDVYIPKITRASFGLSIISNVYLWFAYMVGGFLNIYLINNCVIMIKDNFRIDQSTELGSFSILNPSFTSSCVILLALSILYIGRIITKKKGIFYGKLHFSSFFLIGFTLFVFNLLNTAILLDSSSLVSSILSNYIQIIDKNIGIFVDNAIACATGTLMLATIGEGILIVTPSVPRSLLAISDKLPSDLRVITGHKGVDSKLKEMLSRDKVVTKLRCITKSCSILNIIEMDIYNQFFEYEERKKQDGQTCKPCLQIINAPEDKFLADLDKSLGKLSQRSIGIFSKRLNKEERINQYNKSKMILNNLKNDKMAEVRESYFGDLRFVSIDYENQDKSLMLIVRDGGSLMDRVGVYTEEPYIIDIFINLFDKKWE